MIMQIENAVSAEDCRRLITIYDRHVHLTNVKDDKGHPVVYWDQFRDAPDAAEIVSRLIEECLSHMVSRLGIVVKFLAVRSAERIGRYVGRFSLL